MNREAVGVEFQVQAMVAHMALGILLAERGRTELGVQQLRLAVDEAEGLIRIEPRNAFWKTIAANAHLELAKSALGLGRHEDAGTETIKGCALATGLKASGAGIQRVRVVQTDCLLMRSRLALADGSSRAATPYAERALASARLERGQDPVTDRYRVAAALLLLGDMHQRNGDGTAARSAWNSGLAQLPKNVAERPQDMNTRAGLLRRVGREAETRPLEARLEKLGYRSIV
jgi:hypothetical protein